MSYPRVKRLSEEIKKIVSNIIRNELRDPRIAPMTSIVEVDVTRDLRYVNIYISVLGTEKEKEATMEGLIKASGFIRREIGQKIKARYTPEVIFKLDESIERGIYMYNVITKVNEQNPPTSDEDKTDE
ncbi:30S ribosome-binding factor RbfA [Alkaliphilus sp. B6464]|uniref:30S ribosome-binding factor RbfA n=1 Tax=Alkaliphilus sp. B6464 TaxID=2731219 RepID=UPI001BAB5E87|nr:30S ribosome-binding factor RbfA [Alkaliphilus sp. B6464]QUH20792.1 30S ribosome-binding factor RbfA [Alkaliphilus sp. B6464]